MTQSFHLMTQSFTLREAPHNCLNDATDDAIVNLLFAAKSEHSPYFIAFVSFDERCIIT